MVESTTAKASWNPLRVCGTALPPQMLLAAKFITIAVFVTGEVTGLPNPFVPFLGVFLHFGSSEVFHRLSELVFSVAAAGLLLNRWVRTNCLVMGSVVLVGLLSSRLYYHNNKLYTALLLLILGLYDRRVGTRILRYQLAVLYGGAALNKLLLSDWRDGAFVQNWLPHYLHGYTHVANALGDGVLSTSLSWIAIVTEVCLAVMFLIPRLVPSAAWLGMAYHTGLVTLTLGNTFGLFWYALMASFLAVAPWPEIVTVTLDETRSGHRTIGRLLSLVDFDRIYRLRPASGPLEVDAFARRFTAIGAVTRLFLYLPIAYLLAAVVFGKFPQLIPVVLVVVAAIGISALTERAPRLRLAAVPSPGRRAS